MQNPSRRSEFRKKAPSFDRATVILQSMIKSSPEHHSILIVCASVSRATDAALRHPGVCPSPTGHADRLRKRPSGVCGSSLSASSASSAPRKHVRGPRHLRQDGLQCMMPNLWECAGWNALHRPGASAVPAHGADRLFTLKIRDERIALHSASC